MIYDFSRKDRMRLIWALVVISLVSQTTAGKTQTSSKVNSLKILLKSIIEKERHIIPKKSPKVYTTDGAACVFPFRYGNTLIFSCFCKYSARPWCATTADYETDRKWGYCKMDNKNVVLFGGKSRDNCSFPFTYRGVDYETCPCFKRDEYAWCSTKRIYDPKGSYRQCAVTVCPADYCFNGGKCTVAESEGKPVFKCECTAGYKGTRCRTPVCMDGYCKNNGTCVIRMTPSGRGLSCKCLPFFTGDRCDKPRECGKPANSLDTRIIGGTESKPHAWPWMARILYSPFGDFTQGQFHKCGGSVIGDRWILSAAHCFDWYNRDSRRGVRDETPTHYKILLGDHSGTTTEKGEMTFSVDTIFIHPKWDITRMLHDIALVYLTKPITFSNTIRPICLTETTPPDLTQCYVTGWGRTNGYNHNSGATELMQVKMTLLPGNKCNGLLDNVKIHCFGYDQKSNSGHIGACNGDSGGPVNCEKDGVWYQPGITSMVQDAFCSSGLSFFTDATQYQDYIRATIIGQMAAEEQSDA